MKYFEFSFNITANWMLEVWIMINLRFLDKSRHNMNKRIKFKVEIFEKIKIIYS